jgi:hypothetical protein
MIHLPGVDQLLALAAPNAPAPTGSANGKRRRLLPRQIKNLRLPNH